MTRALDGETDHPYKQYVWGIRYIHSPVLRWYDEDADGQNVQTLYYANDANFNVTALVDGSSGDVVERYVYDPYGRATVLNGADDADGQVDEWSEDADGASDVANDILYCGYRYDSETGLYHVRHRVLHPTLGRWLSRDPAGYADGLSFSEYVLGNPASCVDPSGLRSEIWREGDTKKTAERRLAFRMLGHWVTGGGSRWTLGAEVVKQQSEIKTKVLDWLKQKSETLTAEAGPAKPPVKARIRHVFAHGAVHADDSFWTGMVINRCALGFRGTAVAQCDCCKDGKIACYTDFDLEYLLKDRADLHVGLMPDTALLLGKAVWKISLPSLYLRARLGDDPFAKDFDVRIRWHDDCTIGTPCEGIGDTGWPAW